MTNDKLTEILTVVSNMGPGTAPQWNPGMARVYQIGLRNVPDDAAAVLAEAIVDTCTFRPSVHEILALWRQLSGPAAISAADVVAGLSGYVQRYGAYAAPHPTLRNTRVLGAPSEMTPQEAAVVACWGGWEAYANDDSPVGVKRGQALKVAESVIRGGGDDDVRRLRQEYLEARAVAPALEIVSGEPAGVGRSGGEEGGGFVRAGAVAAREVGR